MSVAVRRVSQVIDALAETGGGSAAEIANKLKISRPAVVRLLDAMAGAGIAEKDDNTKNFRLTLKVYGWGARAAGPHLPVSAVREEVARLARGTERPVFYTTLQDGWVIVLERSEMVGDQVLSTAGQGRAAWQNSAHGLVLAAHSPADVTEPLLARERRETNGTSHAREAELREALENARRDGYAISPSQVWGHVLAAPVLDKSGYACGAIGIPIRAAEYSSEVKEHLLDAIKECAARCSMQLGYSSYASAI